MLYGIIFWWSVCAYRLLKKCFPLCSAQNNASVGFQRSTYTVSEGIGLVEVCIELMGRPLTDVGIVQVVSLSSTAQCKQSNALV